MQKPPQSILGSDAGQRLDDRLLQCVLCPSLNVPQDGLQLGERLFNGRKIRRIRREEQKLASSGFDRLLDARPSVSGKIVQDHHLAWTQAGSQDLLHVDLQGRLVCRTIEQHRFTHAGERQRSDQGQIGTRRVLFMPVIVGQTCSTSSIARLLPAIATYDPQRGDGQKRLWRTATLLQWLDHYDLSSFPLTVSFCGSVVSQQKDRVIGSVLSEMVA